MDYLNPNCSLPSFADNVHNKFEVPVISLEEAYYVNCDKSSINNKEKEGKYEEETFKNLEEKVEEVEEIGSHSQLCKCGSNSEICEEFINSFSLQDILSNFELPIASLTDEDEEASANKKQNEDEEELNLIDFLNNTQFLNDFVNRNSVQIDQVLDSVDFIAKSNRRNKNQINDNQLNLLDNQPNAGDNQLLNLESDIETDNHDGKIAKLFKNAIIDGARDQQILVEQNATFINEESSSDFSVQSEEDSYSNSCANYNTPGQDGTHTIPLPSFDTFKSKNAKKVQCQLSSSVESDSNMRDNIKTAINKCLELFCKQQNNDDQLTQKQEEKITEDSDNESVMGININQQINDFERYTEEPSIFEQYLSNQKDSVPCDEIVKTGFKDILNSKNESQKCVSAGIEKIMSNTQTASAYVQTDVHETIEKGKTTLPLTSSINTQTHVQRRPIINQFEEVIDSGNFWINKFPAPKEPIPTMLREKVTPHTARTPNSHMHMFRVPVGANTKTKTNEPETDENIKKSVKILTKTHLLNSMQFDKNQRNFINSPHFLLLLTKPMKFPKTDGQCCTKKLSEDAKSKLITLQNNIRSQIRNAQLMKSKNVINGQDPNHRLEAHYTGSVFQNQCANHEIPNIEKCDEKALGQKHNTESNMHPYHVLNHKKPIVISAQGNQYDPKYVPSEDQGNSSICNNPSDHTRNQTHHKEFTNVIKSAENFRLDHDLKILTLRTENADCINKKLKLKKVETPNVRNETKSVITKIKTTKVKLNEETFRHRNHKHHHHYHKKIIEEENDPTLRRSERIRVKKERKRLKRCLLSNVKKTKTKHKQIISMSLVDQHVYLENDLQSSSPEESVKCSENKFDLITYKNCFVKEEIVNGQRIQRLDCVFQTKENTICYSQTIETELIQDAINTNQIEMAVDSMNDTPMTESDENHQTNDKTDEVTDQYKETGDKGETYKSNEKKPSSLKSKYPNLEALISSTSNEMKPLIRKRKRIKFDKGKYEEIKKINKEKENNFEQNKILLLNLNKNIHNKVMQNLLLIRDQNNKTHLLFTKPIDNDRVKIGSEKTLVHPEKSLVIQKESNLTKLNENNPNYINKKIEEIKTNMSQKKNVVMNKVNEKDARSDSLLISHTIVESNTSTTTDKSETLIVESNTMTTTGKSHTMIVESNTLTSTDKESVKPKESENIGIDLQSCANIGIENKVKTPNFIVMSQMNNVCSIEGNNTIDTSIRNKSDNKRTVMTNDTVIQNCTLPSFQYDNSCSFYSLSHEYNVDYSQSITNSKDSKSLIVEKYFAAPTGNLTVEKFPYQEESLTSSYFNENTNLKETSCVSPAPKKKSVDEICHSYNQEFVMTKESELINKTRYAFDTSKDSFGNDFSQIYNASFMKSPISPGWDMKTPNYDVKETIVQNKLKNTPIREDNETYDRASNSNTISPTLLQFKKDSNRLQNNNFHVNTQPKLFDQHMGLDLSTQTYIPEDVSTMNIPTTQGLPESGPIDSPSLFLDVAVSNSSAGKAPVQFSSSGMIHSSRNDQNFSNMFEGVEACWEESSSEIEWSSNSLESSLQMGTSNSDMYDEHLELSEEIIKKSLQEDEKIFENEKLHVCTIEDCNSVFQTQSEWEEHARMHAVQRPFGCRYCDKAFKTSGDLSKHSASHNGDRPYKCNYTSCGRHFRTQTQRQIHERCHQDSKPYSCNVCARTFISNTHKNNHMRIHYGLKPYVCHVEGCKRKFVDLSSLKKHTKIHTQQTFHCNLCNKTYKHQQSIITHYQESHGVVVQDVSVFVRK
uniref:Zinc finger protein 143 n=1 Tax=Cacopsylla melanoneura TaxID=428564 RepID=A0A8D8X337_9HEMI